MTHTAPSGALGDFKADRRLLLLILMALVIGAGGTAIVGSMTVGPSPGGGGLLPDPALRSEDDT